MARLFPATLLICALLVPALPAAPASADEVAEKVQLEAVLADLESLETFVKKRKRTDNVEFKEYLSLVASAYGNFEEPEAPAEDASDEVKKQHAKVRRAFDKGVEDFQKRAEKAIFKCLTMVKLDRNENNTRTEVNQHAASEIAGMAPRMGEDSRERISKSLIKELEGLRKAKYDVDALFLEKAFAALAALDVPSSLGWMKDNFIHTKSTDSEIDRLVAAHKAMVMFTKPKGKVRFEIVKEMIKTYAGVESQAEQNSSDAKVLAKKAFWDRIRVDTIKVVQTFAGDSAQTPEGQIFNRMQEFQQWWNDNKNPKKAPWTDPKPAE